MVAVHNLSTNLAHQRQESERSQRLAAIKTAWDYYEGRHPKTLKVKPGQYDDNVVVNLARPIVDKGISLLFGKGVGIQIDEDGGSDSKAEAFIKATLKANKFDLKLHALGQNGALGGNAYIKLNPTPGLIRTVVLDPATVEPRCAHDDVDDIDRYRIQYESQDSRGQSITIRQDITRAENGLTWLIVDSQADSHGIFVKQKEVVWPYAWSPVFHCQNLPAANCIVGYGDLEDAALNDALNSIASMTRKTIRIHAHPRTVGKGFSANQLQSWGADDMWFLPDADADIFNLEMKSDLAAAREFYQTLRAAFFATTRIPDMSTVTAELGTLTNFGLRVLFADALEKTATKRITYGGMIAELCQRIAELGGFGPDVQVSLTWPDPLPVDTAAKATEVQTKKATGLVSDETLTVEMQYDYANEQTRIAQQPQRPTATVAAGATPATAAPATSSDQAA